MIKNQNVGVRFMFYGLMVMIGILAGLIALNLRRPYSGLVLLAHEEGDIKTYGHLDSFGVTEVIQDGGHDGRPPSHLYRFAVSVETALVSAVGSKPRDSGNHDVYAVQFISKKAGQRNASLSVANLDGAGLLQECNISFSDGLTKPDMLYSDWNFDGRIDVEFLKGGDVMNVRMGSEWLPVLMDRPKVHGAYVTVILDGVETRIDFVNGAFVRSAQ